MKIHENIKTYNINFSANNKNGSKINTVYYNDVHSSTKYIDSFIEEKDKFYKEHKDETNLTLCGGDLFLDFNSNNEIMAEKLGNETDAFCIGNHDLEFGDFLAKIINKFNLKDKFLSANIEFTKDTPIKDVISKSKILDKNGERIGLIGVSPLDFEHITYTNEYTDFIKTSQIDETVDIVKNEVKKLEKENIDKIFLLAHTGNYDKTSGEDFYKRLSNIGGIDVIIGGHDHFETDRWETSERNEPVKIVATGKSDKHSFGENLDYAGFLNLEFDKNGILIKEKCQNSVKKLTVKRLPQKNNAIFKLEKPLMKSDRLKGHSEIGNLVADANLWYVNSHTKGKKADFAIVNPGSIRDNFDDIYITPADINNTLPFTTSKLMKADVTKEQIINTLNWGVLTSSFAKISPGVLHVSGLEYTINPDLTVSNVHILNDDDSIKYNLDEFDNNDKFTMAYDVFLSTGTAGLKDIKKDIKNDKDVEIFDITRQGSLLEYLTTSNEIKDYTKKRIYKNNE